MLDLEARREAFEKRVFARTQLWALLQVLAAVVGIVATLAITQCSQPPVINVSPIIVAPTSAVLPVAPLETELPDRGEPAGGTEEIPP